MQNPPGYHLSISTASIAVFFRYKEHEETVHIGAEDLRSNVSRMNVETLSGVELFMSIDNDDHLLLNGSFAFQ